MVRLLDALLSMFHPSFYNVQTESTGNGSICRESGGKGEGEFRLEREEISRRFVGIPALSRD